MAAKIQRGPALPKNQIPQKPKEPMATHTEIAQFLAREFPQTKCTVEAVGNQSATIRHPIGLHELRPGGTVAGPVLMAVADVALYVAILGEIGIVPPRVHQSGLGAAGRA